MTQKASILPLSNFGVKKKVIQAVQIWGGREEVMWTKSKRTASFFGETFPKASGQLKAFLSICLMYAKR